MKGWKSKILYLLVPVACMAMWMRAEKEVSLAEDTASRLFMPNSYEEYLPLTSPTDVAVSRNYIAISDESCIYLYHKLSGEYTKYQHGTRINELEFSGDTLYFLDQAMNLYREDASALPDEPFSSVDAVQHCVSFALSNDEIYLMKQSGNSVQIYSAPLSSPMDETPQTEPKDVSRKPAITIYNGSMYYTYEAVSGFDSIESYLRILQNDEFKVRLTEGAISSVALSNDVLYYTASTGFYAYGLTALRQGEDALLFRAEGNYTSVSCSQDGYVYLVNGRSIKQYDPQTENFTSYEIASSSTSPHRLNEANDSTLLGDELYFADKERVVIANRKENTYQTFPSMTGKFIATDGKTILLAERNSACLYQKETGEVIKNYPNISANIVGITNVYGTYYIATEIGFCKIENESHDIVSSASSTQTPALLTSDIYGDLYVAFKDGKVYRYTEEEFLTPDSNKPESEIIAVLPSGCTKFSVDFNRNVYALKDGQMHVYYEDSEKVIPLAKSVVYSQTAETPVQSFAFGVEENASYVLYQGNFVVEDTSWEIPTMQTIPVEGADEGVFSETETSFSLVEIDENALFIHFSIDQLNGEEYFPYLLHERREQPAIALKLGEAGRFNIVAVYDEATKEYFTAVVEKVDCIRELLQEDYLKDAVGFGEDNVGYITTDVPLYKFPYLTDLLTVDSIEKHSKVKIIGAIEDLDYKYYLVEYTAKDGTIKRGYLPQSYVSPFDGRYPDPIENEFGKTGADKDSVWRAVYILLGGLAICVLVDYLILKKKD